MTTPAVTPYFRCMADAVGPSIRLRLAGELSFGTAKTFVEDAREPVSGADDVVVDLSRVSMIDRAGYHALRDVAAMVEQNGGSLSVVGANRRLRTVIEVVDPDGPIHFLV